MRRLFFVLITAFHLGLSATHVAADIYSYTDENGISHFTNCPGQDERYKLAYRLPKDQPNSKSLPTDSKKLDCPGLETRNQTPKSVGAAPTQPITPPNRPVTDIRPMEKASQPLVSPNGSIESKSKESSWAAIFIASIVLIALLLITQRWFWLVAFSFGALASLFAMVASVIHFHIFAAVGFFVLASICGGIASALAEA